MLRVHLSVLFVALLVLGCPFHARDARAEEGSADESLAARKAALAEFNSLIGKWRGTGLPRRGSNQGAWREDAEWIWDFSDDGVALRYDVADGTLMKSARVTYDPPSKKYQMELTTPDDARRTYEGSVQAGKLTLVSKPDAADEVHRLTITRLNEKRMLALFEKRRDNQTSYSRVAEVGYTREGTRLATNVATGPECIVTGGEGTIPVTFQGKTYYVCCSGCKQAFEDDPEAVIAESVKRREQERDSQK